MNRLTVMITATQHALPLALCLTLLLCGSVSSAADVREGHAGDGFVEVSGELRQWHKVTLTLDGPFANEQDTSPNPFTDLAMNVTFTHASGMPTYIVPGYFAADGHASGSSASCGTSWRAHLSPDKAGRWTYIISFKHGPAAAVDGGGELVTPFDGVEGSFEIGASDKTGRDFRAHGRLQYVGKHHLQFADSKKFFLKAGADAPETMLGYVDFDNTIAGKPKTVPLKTWAPHQADWTRDDPTWKAKKGKGLIGALNYLASKGVNSFSFLTYNAGGDGDNVWPFVERDDKLHYDCSKLDQWGVVFDHATHLGLHLHFKLQETEIDDNRTGQTEAPVPQSLDGGLLEIERKLYCRELIARFGHALALNWNIGEENTQSSQEVRSMVDYLTRSDPYRHPIVLHTYPNEQDKRYTPLLGDGSQLTGVSLQNHWSQSHQRTLKWIEESNKAGRPWVVAHDEQNLAELGVPQDIGYKSTDGIATEKTGQTDNQAAGDVAAKSYTMHDIRKLTLWGQLMAGGAGVEYYFGYALPENDLTCQDFRSRDKSWDFCLYALEFFSHHEIPFGDMHNADALVGNESRDNSKYCLVKNNDTYVVYLPQGGTTQLDLSAASGSFSVKWYNPRTGGQLQLGSTQRVSGGAKVSLGQPPTDPTQDWVILLVTSH